MQRTEFEETESSSARPTAQRRQHAAGGTGPPQRTQSRHSATMEGGGRGRQTLCNPSVILLTLCILSGIIGWQLGNRHGERRADGPPCPPAEEVAASLAAPKAPPGDQVRILNRTLGRCGGLQTCSLSLICVDAPGCAEQSMCRSPATSDSASG